MKGKTSFATWAIGAFILFVIVRCSMRETPPASAPPATASAPALAPAPALVPRSKAELAAEKKKTVATAKALAANKRKEGVGIGMTQADVLASSWGKPRKVNTTTRASGVRAQWVYDGGYLYFEDGILTSIQN